MSSQEAAPRSTLRFVLPSVITTISVTTGVVMFFMNQKIDLRTEKHSLEIEQIQTDHQRQAHKYEDEIDRLKRRVSSVERTIGSSSNSLDVRQLMVHPRQASQRLASSEMFPDDEFFARKVAAGDTWRYEARVTELELEARRRGVPARDLQELVSPQQLDQLTAFPFHMWSGGDSYVIEGQPQLSRLTPYIIVQRAPHDQISQLMVRSVRSDAAVEETDASGEAAAREELSLKELDQMYRGDQAGAMLAGFLMMEIAAGSLGNATTEMHEVHKIGNTVYAHMETTLRDVTVNGRPAREFLLIHEILIISTATDLYVVKTEIPTPPDYSSDAIAWINEWFLDFGIRTPEASHYDAPRTAGQGGRLRLQ